MSEQFMPQDRISNTEMQQILELGEWSPKLDQMMDNVYERQSESADQGNQALAQVLSNIGADMTMQMTVPIGEAYLREGSSATVVVHEMNSRNMWPAIRKAELIVDPLSFQIGDVVLVHDKTPSIASWGTRFMQTIGMANGEKWTHCFVSLGQLEAIESNTPHGVKKITIESYLDTDEYELKILRIKDWPLDRRTGIGIEAATLIGGRYNSRMILSLAKETLGFGSDDISSFPELSKNGYICSQLFEYCCFKRQLLLRQPVDDGTVMSPGQLESAHEHLVEVPMRLIEKDGDDSWQFKLPG